MHYHLPLLVTFLTIACQSSAQNVVKPVIITDTVRHDTDDPAIWINPADHTKSLIIGTDKDQDGGLYVFNLQGKIVQEIQPDLVHSH
ncbi:MAG: phytase, partial [Cytophagaceae bacterium]